MFDILFPNEPVRSVKSTLLHFPIFDRVVADWYPKHIEVQQEGTAVTVTFNLAPSNLGITSYFTLCYANGVKKYIDITPVSAF